MGESALQRRTPMDDRRITDLYWNRDEEALALTERALGGYLLSIARRILGNEEDARECVNDCLLEAWNSIPPNRPESLANFLGRIARRRAIDRLRRKGALKRGGGEADAAFEELEDVVASAETPETLFEKEQLAEAVRTFVRGMKQPDRDLFIRRYWFMDTVADLAARWDMTTGQVTMRLARSRKKLAAYLKKEKWIE